MGILSWIVFGLIAGIIAKWIMPGKDPGGFGRCLRGRLAWLHHRYRRLHGRFQPGQFCDRHRRCIGVAGALPDAQKSVNLPLAVSLSAKPQPNRDSHDKTIRRTLSAHRSAN